MRLRDDDEQLLDDVKGWQARPTRDVCTALVVALHPHHGDAIVQRLKQDGWELERRPNELRSPRGDRLYVITEGNAAHSRGRKIDRCFIHSECRDHERLRAALYPCLA